VIEGPEKNVEKGSIIEKDRSRKVAESGVTVDSFKKM
jgi:hypothetical protein